jgi:hypothetical protein
MASGPRGLASRGMVGDGCGHDGWNHAARAKLSVSATPAVPLVDDPAVEGEVGRAALLFLHHVLASGALFL